SASFIATSTTTGRESPSAFLSHHALTDTLESVRGSFFFQASNKKISADGFNFAPASSEALTSALPGTQTRSHSSHDTRAFSSFGPAATLSATVSGGIHTVS